MSLTATTATDQADVWIGAVSFEERCLGSIGRLRKDSGRRRRAVILSYGNRATRGHAAAQQRARHLEEMVEHCRASFEKFDIIEVEPYSITDVGDLIGDLLRTADDTVIDLTCLTKVHTIGAARACASSGTAKWHVAYTLPSNYGASDTQGPWRDTLLVPIGDHPELRRPGQSRGLMLLGSEPTRVVMTMSELEPSAGAVIVTTNRERPDFGGRASEMNADLLEYLAQSSMPDAKLSTGFRGDDSWHRVTIDLSEFTRLDEVVDAQIDLARLDGFAPVVLFPYGPKPLIFSAAYRLATRYGRSSWALYTVRDSHSVHYCEGFEETLWITLKNST